MPDSTVAFVSNCAHCLKRGLGKSEILLGFDALRAEGISGSVRETATLVEAAELTVLTSDAENLSLVLGAFGPLAARGPGVATLLWLPPLESGACDSEHRPRAHVDEFETRILRRTAPALHDAGLVVLDTRKSELRKGQFRVRMTPVQCDVLRALLVEPGNWVASTALLESVYGEGHAADESLLRVHIRKIRAALATAARLQALPSPPIQLLSARGFGYRIT